MGRYISVLNRFVEGIRVEQEQDSLAATPRPIRSFGSFGVDASLVSKQASEKAEQNERYQRPILPHQCGGNQRVAHKNDFL